VEAGRTSTDKVEVTAAVQKRFLFCAADMPTNTGGFGDASIYRGGEEPTNHMWTCLTALAGNGSWQYDEEDSEIYDIWTVPLRYSLFRVLLTQRWQRHLNQRSAPPPSSD